MCEVFTSLTVVSLDTLTQTGHLTERNADKNRKEDKTSQCFSYFGLMADWGLTSATNWLRALHAL